MSQSGKYKKEAVFQQQCHIPFSTAQNVFLILHIIIWIKDSREASWIQR